MKDENTNTYYQTRKSLGLTREKASELTYKNGMPVGRHILLQKKCSLF